MDAKLSIMGCSLALLGCAGAIDLASDAPSGAWRFQSDYQGVSQCLVQGLNHEWQPKTSTETFWAGNISHHIDMIEPNKINYVLPESKGPSAGWVFKVTHIAKEQTTASAHALHNMAHEEIIAKMGRAATNCGGTPLE
ncbi:hypothetical protein FM996_18020 [Methylosinus sporium]|uniref:Uncharacterized protein n=2 Tax=Methylosinus sporium TaxID=428 RepID=A0A549SH76_METSR|nr:hypothetical protein FM996_18020 [Methylosinus sporium]